MSTDTVSSSHNGKRQIKASAKARRTSNPIRNLVDKLDLKPNPKKKLIPLSIGDPTIFGNLPTDPNVIHQLEKAVKSCKHNGYVPSFGMQEAREAIADFVSVADLKPKPTDVFLSSGCSSALEMAITVLADPGENILIPRPGFPLYQVVCNSHGIKFKFYDLLPHKNWDADLDQMTSLIDENTRAILINNPSNPCGSVFSRTHIRAIIDVAKKHQLPIIADEIYAHFVFGGKEFVWFAEESGSVPIISCGGIAKRYLVPGWRLGWSVILDRDRVMDEIRKGLVSLSQVILGPNTLVQSALAKILTETPPSFHENVLSVIEKNANTAFDCLTKVPGLTPIKPQGAMYMMCCIDLRKFPSICSEVDFVQRLTQEESVIVLPGQCFDLQNSFRLVLTVPEELLGIACKRIEEFCENQIDRTDQNPKRRRIEGDSRVA